MRHIHRWVISREGDTVTWACSCGKTQTLKRRERYEGTKRRRQCGRQRKDLTASQIDALFDRAKARQLWERRKAS